MQKYAVVEGSEFTSSIDRIHWTRKWQIPSTRAERNLVDVAWPMKSMNHDRGSSRGTHSESGYCAPPLHWQSREFTTTFKTKGSIGTSVCSVTASTV